ncbi:MAG TPA: type II toxin-antitoxin system VapC family toxin [Pirellulales bacterium]|nr:type II toxin-antitoxin system VapC family toxin [Pirellulales bacterium]
MLIYLDSNVIVYLIERSQPLGTIAVARFTMLMISGDKVVVSDLSRLECRCGPIAIGDSTRLAQFDLFFARLTDHIAPLTTAVCDRATLIRAKYRFKTPDSLHLAAAVESGCDVFLTNDHRLSIFADLRVEVLT